MLTAQHSAVFQILDLSPPYIWHIKKLTGCKLERSRQFNLLTVKVMDSPATPFWAEQTGTENEFSRRFLLFFTTDHRYAFIFEEAGQPETKRSKMSVSRKILGKEYHSASNLRTHRDKCFVGWNFAFLTLRQNGCQFFPPIFWDKQETLGALPLIFVLCRQIDICKKHFTHRASWTR